MDNIEERQRKLEERKKQKREAQSNRLKQITDLSELDDWHPNDLQIVIIEENMDFFISLINSAESIPQFLQSSSIFRDYCIAQNRIDLAIHCVLPDNIMSNNDLVNAYCNALNISPDSFFAKMNWLNNYYQKNNNIFNTILATSLKDEIFNLNESHFERFINHIEIQKDLAKLNEKQIQTLSLILNNYSYRDYDISTMITNITQNLPSYNNLVNAIDVNKITPEQTKLLVSVLQNANNPYNINSLSELENYTKIKKTALVENFQTNSLDANKTNLLQVLFNIDLKEAQYVYEKFCHDADMMTELEQSELPKDNFKQLQYIFNIVNCESQSELANIYNQLRGENIYSNEIPLETYLRSVYSNLYSQSLYNPDEKDQVYGPKEHISAKDTYNGQEVQISIPSTKFNFFAHVVGYCSRKADSISSNYATDWLGRPQLQDHMIACTYLTEEVLGTIAAGRPVFAFDSLEGGAMLAMGSGDIDSIGASLNYNGARELQEASRNQRARYFVPTQLSKAMKQFGGYSELLLERRDTREHKLQKRPPSQIIMITDSIRQGDINRIDTIFQEELSFISQEDRNLIMESVQVDEITEILEKYNDQFYWYATNNNLNQSQVINTISNRLLKARCYEECLRASAEFNIPLVLIDKENCFRRMLVNSNQYDEEMKAKIFNKYISLEYNGKKELWSDVCNNKYISTIHIDSQNLIDYWNMNEISNLTTSNSSNTEDYISMTQQIYSQYYQQTTTVSKYLEEHSDSYNKYMEDKRIEQEEFEKQQKFYEEQPRRQEETKTNQTAEDNFLDSFWITTDAPTNDNHQDNNTNNNNDIEWEMQNWI